MKKIRRTDAFISASKAIQKGNYDLANNIIEIIDKSIERDSRSKMISDTIVLKKGQKKYFGKQK